MTDKPDTFWNGDDPGSPDFKKSGLPTSEKDKQKPVKEKPVPRLNIEGEKIRNGLGQLILTVVELLRELMEKQAIRRIEAGALTDEQVERLGMTFMNLKKEVNRLKDYFELDDEDLNLALGPLMLTEDTSIGEEWKGKASAVEILDRLLATGVVVRGDVLVSVAEVDLLSVNLGLLLASIDKARELYAAPQSKQLVEEVRRLREENERLRKKYNVLKVTEQAGVD
jgi:hypothetical protein